MKENFIISGIHVGEHSFVPSELIKEFETRGVQNTSFLTIRMHEDPIDEKYFYEWARWCKDHKVYFMTLFTIQRAPVGRESHVTPEIVTKMKEIGYLRREAVELLQNKCEGEE